MKDQAIETAARLSGHRKLAALREYLQAEILFSLQNQNAFQKMAFVGGTALRFLHGIGRYSEDLDFSAAGEKFDPAYLWTKVTRDLADAGYQVSMHPRKKGAIAGVYYRFEGLLHESGISGHQKEKLAIRVEVDLRPPAGAVLQTTMVRRHFILSLRHYDLASLFAGKCHAVLQRRYTKGRDVYDLAWYLTQPGIEPNLILLNNALRQTGWKGPEADKKNWKDILAQAVEHIDWKAVREELSNFLETPAELTGIQKESLLSLLRQGNIMPEV